jgi:hypothetical protein
MRGGAFLLFLLVMLIASCATFPGCGRQGTPGEITELLELAASAGESISSYHMELSMYFQSGQSGRLRTEKLVIDISGEDVAVKDTFYDPDTGEGTVIQEVVRVGGRQYARDLQSGAWKEEEPTAIEEAAATYTSHISDFASNSTSAEDLGEERVNGVPATHLRFQLSPRNVVDLLPSTPQPNLDANTGGQVDIWIGAGTHYPVKYEMVFRNVTIAEGLGNADVIVTIDITDINGTVKVEAPV